MHCLSEVAEAIILKCVIPSLLPTVSTRSNLESLFFIIMKCEIIIPWTLFSYVQLWWVTIENMLFSSLCEIKNTQFSSLPKALSSQSYIISFIVASPLLCYPQNQWESSWSTLFSSLQRIKNTLFSSSTKVHSSSISLY